MSSSACSPTASPRCSGARIGIACPSCIQTASARAELATANDDVSSLKAQKNRYADVLNAQAESQKISTALATLMADDLQWSKLIGTLRADAPGGVDLTTIGGKVGTSAGAAAGAAAGGKTVQLPDHSGHKLVGQLTMTGTAPNKAAVAAYSDALDKVTGLTRVLVTSTTLADGSETFTVQADLTDQILAGRFTPTTSTGSGAN